MTKILLISDFDNIAVEMNANLNLYGYQSTLLTTKEIDNDQTAINISEIKNKKILWFLDAMRSFFFRYLIFWTRGFIYYQDISEKKNYYDIKRIIRKVHCKPDIILLMFDYRIITTKTVADLYEWSNAQIIWMMVDMKPMTGGCSYSGECIKYQTDCNKCPAIGNTLFKNYPRISLSTKIENLKNINLKLIAGSSYQAEQTRLSTVFKDKSITKIFFPVEKNVFNFRDRIEARTLLSLPKDKKIIMFGATSLNQKRKGFKYLLDALEILKSKLNADDVMLLVLGNGEIPELDRLPFHRINMGFVNFEKLALAYQSADVFVCPTIEDSGPIMINQSIMCGTPVVAFKMGVCIDLIENGKTGYLAELKDAFGLSIGILNILSLLDSENEKMIRDCLTLSKELNYETFVGNFQKLINQ